MDNIVIDQTKAVEMFKRLQFANVIKKKDVRGLYRRAVAPARRAVISAARSAIGFDGRKAANAVKMVIYRDANGANISLYDGRAAKVMAVEPSHSTGGRSGIRRKRPVSARTKQINAYRGKDRAFILRFINQGTVERTAGTRDKAIQPASRGRIQPRKFFNVAAPEMEKAAKRVSEMMGEVIMQISENK